MRSRLLLQVRSESSTAVGSAFIPWRSKSCISEANVSPASRRRYTLCGSNWSVHAAPSPFQVATFVSDTISAGVKPWR